jgi:hypothetical protein
MTSPFLDAVIDVLLPGEGVSLPGGRAAGINLAGRAEAAVPVLT